MSENKTFSVQVSTTSAKKIGVSSNVSENPITATSDTGLYYSQLAKNWAIGEGLIENTDYSSKAYAQESKAYALDSKAYSESASLDLNNLNNAITQYDEQITNTVATGLAEITTLQESSLSEIETLRTNAVEDITTNKTNALFDITSAENKALANIEIDLNNATSEINTNRTNTLAQISTLANTSISDINAVGNSYDNITHKNITNCLLEVPQRIKYTLENGTLTIKAGSVVIVPYGTTDRTSEFPIGSTFINDNFKVYDTQFADGKFFVWAELVNDFVRDGGTTTDTNNRGMCLNLTSYGTNLTTNSGSGSTAPTGTKTGNIWYNTTENLVKRYDGTEPVDDNVRSLIFMRINADGTYYQASIDQVFNGFGYIGSTIWVDKGVKGLIPNGRNEDGSLRNVEFVTENVITVTITDGATMQCPFVINSAKTGNTPNYSVRKIFRQDTQPTSAGSWYDTLNNYWYYSSNGTNWAKQNIYLFVSYDVQFTNGKVTNLKALKPFRAVDYNEFANTPHITETYVNGTSWYRVWSDGWIEQGGRVSLGNGANTTIKLLKNFSNTNYGALGIGSHTASVGACFIYDKTTSSFVFKNSANTSSDTTWYAYGY